MRIRVRVLVLIGLLLSVAPAAARESARRTVTLGARKTWATEAYVQDSGAPGPTVVIVAGMHGNEPASTYAADQIRHWPIRRGRLAIVPRANVEALRAYKRKTPGVAKSLGDLNRNFPRAGRKEQPRGVRARALWSFARSMEPDWLVDLHEGAKFRRVSEKSVGNSVIAGKSDEAQIAATFLLDAVNATIQKSQERFVRLGPPVDGGIARAAAEHLGAKVLLLETTWTLARSLRARQHRLMVHRLLLHLGMIAHDFPVDTLLPEDLDGKTVVGLYDAGGTGGNGVPYIWKQLRRRPDLLVARVGPPEIRAGALKGFDVVIFPGGTGSGQGAALGSSGRRALKGFVEAGGGYVGVCAGAYLACTSFSWGAHVLDARTVSPKWRRGRATLRIELTERGREIFGDELDGPVGVLFNNGPVLGPAGSESLPDYEPLAVFRTEVAKNGTPKGIQVGTPAIACGACGAGRVLVFSPHPEQTKGLEWLVERAVRWTAGASKQPSDAK